MSQYSILNYLHIKCELMLLNSAQITEAASILTDPQRRKAYNMSLSKAEICSAKDMGENKFNIFTIEDQ